MRDVMIWHLIEAKWFIGAAFLFGTAAGMWFNRKRKVETA